LGAFGEKLRKQREQRGLALDAISNSTKISTRMLRALEDEHFDQLPGGVFNKGFVRAYARQVGLNEEEAITDYLAALSESQVQSQKILPDFRAPGDKARPIIPHDSRHHILPSSNHPGADSLDKANGSHDADRRRSEERRNEVRRNQDRNNDRDKKAPFAPALHNDETKNGRKDSREKDDHEIDPRRRDPLPTAQVLDHRSQNHRNDEHRNDEHRGKDHAPHTSSSMTGFITLGAAAENSTAPTDAGFPRLSRGRKLGAALFLLTVGLTIWWSHRSQGSAPNSAASSNPSPAATAVQSPAPAVNASAAPEPTIAQSSPTAKPSLEKSSAATPSTSAKASITASAPKAAADSSAGDSFVTESTTRTLAAKPPATFTLRIRADQTTWISITADGKDIGHETLIAPAHTSVRATRDVAVKVGNAAGVSFLLNGKEFPAQGNVGEVKTYVFDASGLKPGPDTPPPSANR
jgi:cytoskeletal protein RodZ